MKPPANYPWRRKPFLPKSVHTAIDLRITISPLFLGRELWLAHLVTPQDDVEGALHLAEKLLIRCRSSALEVGDDGGRTVALLGEVLLCHGRALVVLGLGACLADGLTYGGAYSLGLHDVVAAVDLGETLTFGACAAGAGLVIVLASVCGECEA